MSSTSITYKHFYGIPRKNSLEKSDLSLKNRKKEPSHCDVSIFISINPVVVKHRAGVGNATAGPIFLCGPYASVGAVEDRFRVLFIIH